MKKSDIRSLILQYGMRCNQYRNAVAVKDYQRATRAAVFQKKIIDKLESLSDEN